MSPEKRLVKALNEFCLQECRLHDFRQESKGPCTEKSKSDYRTGDPGQGPCDIHDPEAGRCERCEARFRNRQDYRSALKKRTAAKRRVVLAWISIPHDSPLKSRASA